MSIVHQVVQMNTPSILAQLRGTALVRIIITAAIMLTFAAGHSITHRSVWLQGSPTIANKPCDAYVSGTRFPVGLKIEIHEIHEIHQNLRNPVSINHNPPSAIRKWNWTTTYRPTQLTYTWVLIQDCVRFFLRRVVTSDKCNVPIASQCPAELTVFIYYRAMFSVCMLFALSSCFFILR